MAFESRSLRKFKRKILKFSNFPSAGQAEIGQAGGWPIGPAGKPTEIQLCFPMIAMTYTKVPNACKAFMAYMLFIIGHLAWESKAGKFGTFVIFLGLAFGMVGFMAKGLIQWFLEK